MKRKDVNLQGVYFHRIFFRSQQIKLLEFQVYKKILDEDVAKSLFSEMLCFLINDSLVRKAWNPMNPNELHVYTSESEKSQTHKSSLILHPSDNNISQYT